MIYFVIYAVDFSDYLCCVAFDFFHLIGSDGVGGFWRHFVTLSSHISDFILCVC